MQYLSWVLCPALVTNNTELPPDQGSKDGINYHGWSTEDSRLEFQVKCLSIYPSPGQLRILVWIFYLYQASTQKQSLFVSDHSLYHRFIRASRTSIFDSCPVRPIEGIKVWIKSVEPYLESSECVFESSSTTSLTETSFILDGWKYSIINIVMSNQILISIALCLTI